MKKLLLLFNLIGFITYGQIVNIPDTNFKNKLLEASPGNSIAFNANGDNIIIDSNSDGEIQESEALVVTGLLLNSDNISDLTGINSFTNLSFFDFSSNQITSFDASGLPNLTYLDCKDNLLTDLDLSGLSDLEYLYCDDNSLTTLDLTGLNSLIDVWCTQNQLTSINIDPGTTMNYLSFNENQISDISFLFGSYFNVVEGAFNQITDLDFSTPFANYCVFFFNPLETVNIKNGTYDYDSFVVDFNILPGSPLFICADDIEIDNIINDVMSVGADTVVSPYCTFEPGGEYNLISGTLRFDLDNDGCSDLDYALPNVSLELDNGLEQNFVSTNNSGGYLTFLNQGNFTISPSIENPSLFTVSPLQGQYNFSNYGNVEAQDFCIQANGSQQDVEVQIIPINESNPGFNSNYRIVYRNKGNTLTSGTIHFNFDEAVFDYVTSSSSIDNQSSGLISWTYTDILPLETRDITVTLNLNSPMDTPPVNIDDILEFEVSIEPIAGDFEPTDNEVTLRQVVIGSFDPNDITCLEGPIVDPIMIGEYLHYNIRFENTGTAAATFVVITNEINESQFDLTTLQILNASHDMTSRLVGNKLEFIFDDINLPPLGQGNVLYKIKTRGNLNIGDSVSQQANIFFDFNFPIETNIATTTFETLSVDEFTKDDSIQLFPNPVNDQLTIKAMSPIKSIKVFDIHGRTVAKKQVDASVYSLDVSNFGNGIYFVEINSESGSQIEKLIKN